MGENVHVRDIEVLERLRDAALRYQAGITEAMQGLGRTVRAQLDWVDDRVQAAERDVREAECAVEEAAYQLQSCQEDPDRCCSWEEGEYDEARSRLADGRAHREVARGHARRIHQYAESLRTAGTTFTRASQGPVRNAATALSGRIVALRDFAGGPDGALPGAQRPAATVAPVQVAPASTLTGSPTRWSAPQIEMVAVASLPQVPISGTDDFKKVSAGVQAAGIRRIQEMLPAIQDGPGASSDYWAAHDQAQGLSYEDGYQRVYDAFYGQEPVKVNAHADGSYDIDNGNHRIWVARHIGVTHLPMMVSREAPDRSEGSS